MHPLTCPPFCLLGGLVEPPSGRKTPSSRVTPPGFRSALPLSWFSAELNSCPAYRQRLARRITAASQPAALRVC